MTKTSIIAALLFGTMLNTQAQIKTNEGISYLMNQPKDVSADFSDIANTYFFADSLAAFDAEKGVGKVKWERYRIAPRQAFNTNGFWPQKQHMLDFPETAYDNAPELKFQLRFVSPRTVRITMLTTPIEPKDNDADDLMFCSVPKDNDKSWKMTDKGKAFAWSSPYGTIEVQKYPWRIVLKDNKGRVLTESRTLADNDSTQVKILPFNFIKRGSDNSRSINPVFSLAPQERIYGCGESFTSLNKVGQKVQLFVTDPQGPETPGMYKPVPFYFSNRGYGVFMHTSAPVTADFGKSYIGTQSLYMADEKMDFFVFFGQPKDILDEYTDISGKSPMLPLWTFGTWMSRITYFSQKEGLDIAANLRKYKIPADVIHFDTGWFGVDWQCDYQFAADRFENPVEMMKKMRSDGFHVCLWQLHGRPKI